jgi:peptidoglycan/xylan/chitin deacetylase (PgdA/CDA1 family)
VGRRLAKLTGAIERRLWPSLPLILIYHRVAELASDPWGLAVRPDLFAEQVEAVSRVRRIVPLEALIRLAREGGRPERPLAAITFDDGYHDASATARPILERLDCPATVFVATGLVGSGREFWWDELAKVMLHTPSLPQTLALEVPGGTRSWNVPADAAGRDRLCRRLRRQLRELRPAEIDARLAELCQWAGLERSARPDHRVMTGEEIAALAGGPISVGAHTVGHPSLPRLSPSEQLAEIEQSRRACEAMTGAPVRHFAYPFGHYDAASVEAVRAAGLSSACATTPGVVRPLTDPLRLPRISPGRKDGEALTRLLAA